MGNITFNERGLWIIRASYPDEPDLYAYYKTPFLWAAHPVEATILRDYDTAVEHMATCFYARQDDTLYDVVPLVGELLAVAEDEEED